MSGENTARDYSKDLDYSNDLAQARTEGGIESPSNFRVPQNAKAADEGVEYGKKNDEGSHTERLEKARAGDVSGDHAVGKAKEAVDIAKKVAETATPMGAISLISQINFFGDLPFVAAMGAALLKDFLLDPSFIGSLPGIGTVLTVCCSIFIGMMLFLASVNGKTKKKARRMAKLIKSRTGKKIAVIIAGTIFESIFGLNFFPIESVIVIVIYILTLMDRKNAE